MTPEGKVKASIKKLLKEYCVYYDMPVPGGFGKSGLDFHVCHNGYWLSIEAKAPGKKPTPRQLNTMRDVAKAGGAVMVVHDATSLIALKAWLEIAKPIKAMGAIKETMEHRKAFHIKEGRDNYDH